MPSVDLSRLMTLKGLAYQCGTALSGQPGQFTQIQLWNPVGSGITVIINYYDIFTSTTAGVSVVLSGTQASVVVNQGVNKRAGGPPGLANLCYQNGVSAILGSLLSYYSNMANTMTVKDLAVPIALPAGYGLTLIAGPNITMNANYEYLELPG